MSVDPQTSKIEIEMKNGACIRSDCAAEDRPDYELAKLHLQVGYVNVQASKSCHRESVIYVMQLDQTPCETRRKYSGPLFATTCNHLGSRGSLL